MLTGGPLRPVLCGGREQLEGVHLARADSHGCAGLRRGKGTASRP